MGKLTWARKLASLLLLLCFFLPLSQCTTKIDPDGKQAVRTSTLYAVDMARDGLIRLGELEPEGAMLLLSVLAVFVLPAACWRVRDTRRAALLLTGSLVAAYFLYCWVFVFSTAVKLGGILASACWIVLATTSAFQLWRAWRARRTGWPPLAHEIS